MGKRRSREHRGGGAAPEARAARKAAEPSSAAGPDFFTRGANSVKAIGGWDDIEHNSEDEFHEQRGKVLLSDVNQGRAEDDEDDEEEVFNLGSESEEEEDDETADDEEDEQEWLASEDDNRKNDDEEFDSTGWGRNKRAYYDADEVDSDLDEAKEEEVEAIRLQKKHVARLREDDFLDDAADSLGAMDASNGGEGFKRNRLLADIEVRSLNDLDTELEIEVVPKPTYDNLSSAKLLDILSAEAPEILDMASDFQEMLGVAVTKLAPVLRRAKDLNLEQSPLVDFVEMQYHVLLSYLTNVAFYLHLRASGVPNPQDHPVVEMLVAARESLDKLRDLEKKFSPDATALLESEINQVQGRMAGVQGEVKGEEVASLKQDPVKKKAKATEKLRRAEGRTAKEKRMRKEKDDKRPENPPVFDEVVEEAFVPLAMVKPNKRKWAAEADDFHDPTVLDSLDAEDKAQRKRSLRHHALRVVAQADRRATKGSEISGDSDLPRKVRQRRQEARGVPQPAAGVAELDDEDPKDDSAPDADNIHGMINPDEDDDAGKKYYEHIKEQSANKRRKKEEEKEAAAAARLVRVEEPALEAGAKREIGYKILKNKGLTPHRKKENRNPRVKNKNRYERKVKKLSSFGRRGPAGQAGETSGSYGGERTGIRTGVARSIKLQ